MRRNRFVNAGLGLVLACIGAAAGADSGTAKALITWDGKGHVYPIGTETMLFLGAFEGIIYVEAAGHAIDEGFVRCPATMRIDLANKVHSGSGHCMIAIDRGDTVFAEWSCEGKPGGCEGRFTLTEGTGRFAGITGSSPMRVRSPINALAADMSSGSIVRAASGIAILSDLRYNNPAK
jgi:hypothetical protein